MAPSSKVDGRLEFTASETKLLIAALNNIEGELFKFNKTAVANELGFKSAASVNARWSELKRKIETKAPAAPKLKQGDGSNDDGAVEVQKARPKRKNAADADDLSKDTPKPKKSRKPRAKKAIVEKEGDEADGDTQADEGEVKKVEAEGESTDAGTLADGEASS